MPYIEKTRRTALNYALDNLINAAIGNGEIVYCITYLVHRYVLELGQSPNFATKSLGKSILQDALDEYKRIVMDRHEDKKRRENGAISELDAIQPHEVR